MVMKLSLLAEWLLFMHKGGTHYTGPSCSPTLCGLVQIVMNLFVLQLLNIVRRTKRSYYFRNRQTQYNKINLRHLELMDRFLYGI